MPDDKKVDTTAPASVTVSAPVAPGLSVRSVSVMQLPHTISPNGHPVDLVEVELYPHGDGNSIHWMQWSDLLRFRCERGHADALLAAMGLRAK